MPTRPKSLDRSNGYEAVAAEFMRRRSGSVIGVATVRTWAGLLPAGASILDLGSGHGTPITAALLEDGFVLYAVDASPSLTAEFRARFPHVAVACEAAEESAFFGRTFDGIAAIGLMFLLGAEAQEKLIRRVAHALNDRGRFLFTAPTPAATRPAVLTRRKSVSLGAREYERLLVEAGLLIEGECVDEGESHYYACIRQ